MTRIEWCDETLNPLGHGCYGPRGTAENPKVCPYCYARVLARRDLRGCELCKQFIPHTHFEQLEKIKHWKKPRTIFMQSMGDLFHDAIQIEWIQEVFKACAAAPQHQYLFLTKNPSRYGSVIEFLEGERSPINGYLFAAFGATATNEKQLYTAYESRAQWLSIEPLLEDITDAFEECSTAFAPHDSGEHPRWEWVVIGAETGNRKGKISPKLEWIESIVKNCKEMGTPVFMKDSLIPIIGEENMLREFPWKENT